MAPNNYCITFDPFICQKNLTNDFGKEKCWHTHISFDDNTRYIGHYQMTSTIIHAMFLCVCVIHQTNENMCKCRQFSLLILFFVTRIIILENVVLANRIEYTLTTLFVCAFDEFALLITEGRLTWILNLVRLRNISSGRRHWTYDIGSRFNHLMWKLFVNKKYFIRIF